MGSATGRTRTSRIPRAALALLAVAVAGTVLPATAAADTETAAWAEAADAETAARADDRERLLFRIRDERVGESSGLAVSPTHKGIVYTHNDSGNGPQIYAIGQDGRTRATFTIGNAEARDWEGIAASTDRATGRGVLWIADIGDNMDGAWPDVSVYKVAEPRTMKDATLRAVRYRFRYADGPRNAEGVMVDPRTGRLYIVSKEFSGGVYAAPAKLRTDKVNVLRRVGSAPLMATDAAYAPDGSSFVIRTYFSASVYRSPGKLIAHVTMPPLRQAESIAYTQDGAALLTGSEGKDSPVYRVPLPAAARPAPSPRPARTSARPRAVSATSGADSGDGALGVPMPVLWLAVALGAIGIIGFIAHRAGR
ncbi:hypothetical protein [Microbispora bryophytorum]|uniref:Esterase-like activity of phytase family protein n=1 Tax=Microbispora bryophytorum subsp. camponoti TaxID=1677852 RepID=A0ABR8LH93_9ACTN|nr:hypothetical protein [Microbispora camponoti]MBD3147923.1 hypothetical protein [Microbispora camponoti]